VRSQLSDLLAAGDFITQPDERTVQVPVRLLEHARLRLSDTKSQPGAGQGPAGPGDTLRPASADDGGNSGEGGKDKGGFQLLLELKVDDIVDWLTEELALPDLRPRSGTTLESEEIIREGSGRRGIRARLDRRRTVKEAVKRRAVQSDPAPFVDEDLRFHQLRERPRLTNNAVVAFVLDVSASMTEPERKLAKTFFFFALSGLRRQYHRVEVRFVAHTTEAWEFGEQQFFEVAGTGGTAASCAFELTRRMLDEEYEPSSYNAYLFYASDGDNDTDDHEASLASLRAIAPRLNYFGYVETRPHAGRFAQTDMRTIVRKIAGEGAPADAQIVSDVDDVWKAIRHFFVRQAAEAAAAR
jgi:uncharacterized sporulation protein YeaH/YhbH (DUF444 family)